MFKQRSLFRLLIVGLTAISLSGCTFFDELGAVRMFKDANTAYSRGLYEEAIEIYDEILTVISAGGESDLARNLTPAYFYIANSYDSLYKPGGTDAENIHNLDEAIRYYELAVAEIADPAMRLLSMQYLVAAFGPDKANAPDRTEPLLRDMIVNDPENPDNYFRLAQLYEEAGLFEDAEFIYQSVQGFRRDDPIVYLQLAGFYNRAGEFDLTSEALEERARHDPDNPEAYYTISTFYWEKAFRDFRITVDQKRDYVLAGLEASDRALALNERYIDALIYKNILLRMRANDEEDLDLQTELIAEADELRATAERIQQEQRAAAGA